MIRSANSLFPFFYALIFILIYPLTLSAQPATIDGKQGVQFENSKPWSYWWWMGSAVDEENIDYNLKLYKKAGIGGLHIVPIYGVKGEEDKFIDYLSPKWVNMLAYTSEKCKELGIGLDMTLGTGWCFGGPDVDEQTGSMYGHIEKIGVSGREIDLDLTSESKYQYNRVQSVMALLDDGTRVDISDRVDGRQHLRWKAPGNPVALYIIRMQGPVFKVKRAAPGGEGFMLDPFSSTAFNSYTDRFDKAFEGNLNNHVRAIYHDSYEYQADWTPGLFEKFKASRGYDLKVFIPELIGEQGEASMRVIADYRQTMSELHNEYITSTKEWAKKNGLAFRNQGHGSPANWLDIYALADIPETETFGSTPFKIKGLTREKDFINDDRPNRFVIKFASSAAHLMGKPLASSETNTWLREHFRVSLSHSKPELDQLFLSGINHLFYHGIAYSPKGAEWPGWQFYASTSFAPTNSINYHLAAQNQYVERCQKALRSGVPDNDVLVYFPIQDIWHSPGPAKKSMADRSARKDDFSSNLNILYKITAHNYEDWFLPYPIHEVAKKLENEGYAFDYISDAKLVSSRIDGGNIATEGNTYKTLIIPGCEFMPLETLRAIIQLAESGGQVLFMDHLPKDVPGLFELQKRQQQLDGLKDKIRAHTSGNLEIIASDAVEKLDVVLAKKAVVKEYFNSSGLPYIRRKTAYGYLYFLSNIYSGNEVDAFVPLGVDASDVVIIDPVTEQRGKAIIKEINGRKSILLQVEQGQSLILKTYNGKSNEPQDWFYTKHKDKQISINGSWQVEFVDGGPLLPASYTTRKLRSWTEDGDIEAQRFAGLARYSIAFDVDKLDADDYILKLEKVRESAAIRINGNDLPVLFAHPFRQSIGPYLKLGSNELEIEVANLSANRIRDLDQRGVEWKKFHNINFVNIDYKKFDASRWDLVDSGLIGEVEIVPVYAVKKGGEY